MPKLESAVTKYDSLKKDVEKWTPQIAAALPKIIPPERFTQLVLNSFQKTPKLLNCSKGTVYGAVVQAAQLGLEIGAANHCWLIPYGPKCQLLIGYGGMVQLATNSAAVSVIDADVVYENDAFDFQKGTQEFLHHKPYWMAGADEPGKIKAAWAAVKMADGGYRFLVMPIAEIEQHRARSRSANDGPWVTDYAAMAKKTAVRVLCKLLPMSTSPQLAKAIELDEQIEGGRDQTFDVDASFVEVEEPKVEPAPQSHGEEAFINAGKPKDNEAIVQPPKRKRRTKKEMEAARAAETDRKARDEEVGGIEEPDRITPDEAKALFAAGAKARGDKAGHHVVLAVIRQFGYKTAAQIERKDYDQILEHIRTPSAERAEETPPDEQLHLGSSDQGATPAPDDEEEIPF